MIVVSDSLPLIGLAHIGRLDLLRQLYGDVVVPEAVYVEVVTRRAERPGAREVGEAGWITVRPVQRRDLADALATDLGRGESEAIALAAEIPGALLLLDEHRARNAAGRLGVEVIGVLGVLTLARRTGLVPAIRPVLDDLIHRAGFRIGTDLYELVLRQEGEL